MSNISLSIEKVNTEVFSFLAFPTVAVAGLFLKYSNSMSIFFLFNGQKINNPFKRTETAFKSRPGFGQANGHRRLRS